MKPSQELRLSFEQPGHGSSKPYVRPKRQISRDFYMTLDEVVEVLAVDEGVTLTRERVRQIQNTALKRCAEWARKHGYKVEDLI